MCAPMQNSAVSSAPSVSGWRLAAAHGGCANAIDVAAMQCVRERGQPPLRPGRAEQRHADRQPVGVESGRHREGRQVAQIDEVGERAEPAVHADRIGRHLGQRRAERRGRQQQRVVSAEQRCRGAARLGEAVKRVEGIHRAPAQSAFQDRAGHRMQDVRDAARPPRAARRCVRPPRARRRAAGRSPGTARCRPSRRVCDPSPIAWQRPPRRTMRERRRARIRIARRRTPRSPRCTASASSTHGANTEIVSSERQAGTMPRADTLPSVGFSPTMLPNAAGTRPDPAVSVPSANGTIPAATAHAEPDDDPPGT